MTDADALRLADYALVGQGATVTRLCAAGLRRLRDATMPGARIWILIDGAEAEPVNEREWR